MACSEPFDELFDIADAVRGMPQGLKRLIDPVNRVDAVELGGLLVTVSLAQVVVSQVVGDADVHI